MEITFLGTAASTSYPLVFCKCKFCIAARQQGGKNFRKRSSVIINNDLIVDFGPDTLTSSFLYGKDISDVKFILQTHAHSDHFDASHLSTRIPEYMGIDIKPLQIIASDGTLKRMSEMLKAIGYVDNLYNKNVQKKLNITVSVIKRYIPFTLDYYNIIALPTDHDILTESNIYIISDTVKTILYGTDTNSLLEEVWYFLKDNNIKLDLVILDHTYGYNSDSGGHLNAKRFIDEIEKFKINGIVNFNTKFLATHISHEGNPLHKDLYTFAIQNGYEIAFDGLVVKI